MRAEVVNNAVELSFPRTEASLLVVSLLLLSVLIVFAGWQVAFVALGLSLLGAGAVELVQQSDLKILVR